MVLPIFFVNHLKAHYFFTDGIPEKSYGKSKIKDKEKSSAKLTQK
jgi:hypothetical protein